MRASRKKCVENQDRVLEAAATLLCEEGGVLPSDYRDAATRPMLKEDWENEGGNWVLLTKNL